MRSSILFLLKLMKIMDVQQQQEAMSSEDRFQELVDSLKPRTAHQYKTYYTKYIQWCQLNQIIPTPEDNSVNSVPYKDLPISAELIHWFLLDTLITDDKPGEKREETEDLDEEEENSFKIATLKKIIGSLNFLSKLCKVHENPNANIDTKYLESVTKLHTHWIDSQKAITTNETNNTNTQVLCPPLLKVSLNLWNPETNHLSEKFFKTCSEKLRFLVDFQLRSYLNLSFEERSKIRFGSLKLGKRDKDAIIYHKVTHSAEKKDTPGHHQLLALLPQDCPFICPQTTLAAYLYLRFYGIPSVSKGDGFPNLNADENGSLLQDIPILRGKSLTTYPREETFSNYYTTVFRYCHLPYKRREYFNKCNLVYPTWDEDTFRTFFNEENHGNWLEQPEAFAFPDKIPFDFKKIMNFKSPYTSYSTNAKKDPFPPPKDLLVQIFPEIDEYKRHDYEGLSQNSRDFLDLMEVLRERFLSNLPWIYKLFPNHDIFQDPIFGNSDFQSYFNDKTIHSKGSPILSFDILPGFNKIYKNKTNFYSLLIERPSQLTFASSHNPDTHPTQKQESEGPLQMSQLDTTQLNELLKQQSFEYVQFQTLSNFQILLSVFNKIFEKLEMKKSSRGYILHQLNLFKNTLDERIKKSKIDDADKFIRDNQPIKKEENIVNEDGPNTSRRTKRPKQIRLLSIADSSDESSTEDSNIFKKDGESIEDGAYGENEDENDSEMQEQLKSMINELINSKISTSLRDQMDQFELKINALLDKILEEKVTRIIEQKFGSRTGQFSTLKRPQLYMTEEHNVGFDMEVPKKLRTSGKYAETVKDNDDHQAMSTTASPSPEQDQEAKSYTDEQEFMLDKSIDSIEGIILEWFTPNATYANQCVHSMNKSGNKSWRANCEALYKERKSIVEFYIYLVNHESLDRYKAVDICEKLRDQNEGSFSRLAKFLRKWRHDHQNSFDGLLVYLSN
ncbi:CPA_1a_G0021560.mRNA.1.CDS.1 [Saccharomyces cerevisiae]|nr:CPA_1a_G0021560.mRNA.1.CDS.1 [Saccharomyces cerevisiae]CAI7312131.1 CPA_1a_G0021560.mRNA.1.CDS.1 [Saccharomyces cerevisiae]